VGEKRIPMSDFEINGRQKIKRMVVLSGMQIRVAESEVLGWSRIFLSDSGCSIGSFLHHTLRLGVPVEMVQLLLKQVSCCAPRFPLIVIAKFHSLYVNSGAQRSVDARGDWLIMCSLIKFYY